MLSRNLLDKKSYIREFKLKLYNCNHTIIIQKTKTCSEPPFRENDYFNNPSGVMSAVKTTDKTLEGTSIIE